jgi:ATP-dependent Lon protease
MFPLGSVLFPHEMLPLHVFEMRYRQMIASCLEGDNRFGVVLIARGSEVGGGDVRYDRGTVATIEVASPTPDGRYGVLARGGDLLRVHSWLEDSPYPRALVSIEANEPSGDLAVEIAATLTRLRGLRDLWAELDESPPLPEHLALGADFAEQIWRLCSATPLGPLDRQRVLEAKDPLERLGMLDEQIAERRSDYEALLRERRE